MPATELIYLVGFMGAGKTCVGRRLAELLGYGFVDLDSHIEERAAQSIRDIFARHGEQFFRALETEELSRVSALTRHVVALGGGAFCGVENFRIIRGSGRSIWLDAPASVLYARCAGGDSRPLFSTRAEMEALLDRRRAFYQKADIRVDVQDRTIEDIARHIMGALPQR